MTSHKDWFRELMKPDQPRYVETRDDTTHPIRHVGNVPFGNNGKQTYLKNVMWQSKGVVIGLSNFAKRESIGICEACQLGKQLGNQGTMMDRSHERGDTGSMQE